MDWLFTALSIIGVVLNIYKLRSCFIVWSITNVGWMIIDYRAGLHSQAILFAVYLVLSLWGLWQWRSRGARDEDMMWRYRERMRREG